MREPEKDNGENEQAGEGYPNNEPLIPTDSEDDVYEDRLMDARPTGITIPSEDEGE